nr:hypothetical protein [Paracoccus saliphilus]
MHRPLGFMQTSGSSRQRQKGSKVIFQSPKSSVSTSGATEVRVDLKLDVKDVDFETLFRDLKVKLHQVGPHPSGKDLHGETLVALKDAVRELLMRGLAGEFEGIIGAYRDMLEQRAASGQDEAVARALTRVKLQTDVLNSVPMVDQAQACTILGLSTANPSASLRRLEARDAILRFDRSGRASYPLFQFDIPERRVHPVLIKLLQMRSDDWGGKMALLHWLTRPNRNLQGARPCDRLAEHPEAILSSFAAEVAEPLNG